MAYFINLPTAQQTLLTQAVTLDGTSFTLSFDWSGRQDLWVLRILLADGAELVSGVSLVSNTDLLRTVASDNRPGGALFLVSPTGYSPTRENIGSCKLVYVTEEELVP